MSEPDNFLSRWARRKSEAETASPTESSVVPPPDIEVEESVDAANPDQESLDLESLDLESLPSVDSITATTDISGFLRSGVPPELTRSALRQAWASDPAIRDFIGIAENQWDFNDPNAIPGFGLLGATDNLPALLAQALGQVEKLGEAIPNLVSASQPEPTISGNDRTEQTPDKVSPSANRGVGAANEAAVVQSSVTTADEEAQPGHRRRHGSALPR
jgi:hypothetical protein